MPLLRCDVAVGAEVGALVIWPKNEGDGDGVGATGSTGTGVLSQAGGADWVYVGAGWTVSQAAGAASQAGGAG